MTNVVPLNAKSSFDKKLEKAKGIITSGVVIGYDENDVLHLLSSDENGSHLTDSEVNLMLDRIKHELITGDY